MANGFAGKREKRRLLLRAAYDRASGRPEEYVYKEDVMQDSGISDEREYEGAVAYHLGLGNVSHAGDDYGMFVLTSKGIDEVEKDGDTQQEYPHWERRKKLLRAVHDWVETQSDTRTQLSYSDLVALVEDPAYAGVLTPEGMKFDRTSIDDAQARVMNLFVVLVNDGYIDADIDRTIVGLPFTSARVRGLTDKGLRAIGEMPDPGAEIQRAELEKLRQVQEVRARLQEGKSTSVELGREEPRNTTFDVFISHASEDKESFVESLARTISNMGFKVWYDDFTLKVGDSLRESIDRGIADSRYGIVVLSSAFFAKKWPQRELNGLTARQTADGKKVILPIWHNVDHQEVLNYSPTLADTVALRTKGKSIEEIAEDLASVLRR